MNWKEILKTEKLAPLAATAGAVAFASRKALKDKEKIDVDKPTLEKLTGRQKEIDANNDGEISEEDFKLLRDKKVAKKMKSDSQIEKEILAEVKKEGGALGMKNLRAIAPRKDLLRILGAMQRKKKIYQLTDGDYYTHKPSRRRGFTP